VSSEPFPAGPFGRPNVGTGHRFNHRANVTSIGQIVALECETTI